MDKQITKSKNQVFDQPIQEIIRKRISVRTYQPRQVTKEDRDKLVTFANKITGPFAPQTRFSIIDDLQLVKQTGGKIGTYGVIKGANVYLAGMVEPGDKDMEQLGYAMEVVILKATSLGLGTCWLGGTFTRGSFAKAVGLKEGELLPLITPVGYSAEKKSLVERLMRLAASSNKRKPWQELFYDGNLATPLQKEQAGKYTNALEMVLLGPSASNKQPWRIVKGKDNCWHFYIHRTSGYGKALPFDIQRVDMGIAMAHFELTLAEQGIRGQWQNDPSLQTDSEGSLKDSSKDSSYIVSWVEQ